MRVFTATALAASLFATNLYAADVAAPLAPGKPAGVQKAQGYDDNALWWVLGGAAAIAIIVVASSGGNSTPAAAVTATSTS